MPTQFTWLRSFSEYKPTKVSRQGEWNRLGGLTVRGCFVFLVIPAKAGIQNALPGVKKDFIQPLERFLDGPIKSDHDDKSFCKFKDSKSFENLVASENIVTN
jgi:hypothetical protein